MSVVPELEARRRKSRLYVELATTLADIRASQALRYRVFGHPCYGPAFNRADILVLVKVDEIDASYTRHFLDRVMKG